MASTNVDKFAKAMTYLKIFKDRGVGWMSIFNLIMVSVLFVKSFDYSNFGILIYVGGFIAVVAITLFDFFYILPREQEYYLSVNKEWQEKIKRLEKHED